MCSSLLDFSELAKPSSLIMIGVNMFYDSDACPMTYLSFHIWFATLVIIKICKINKITALCSRTWKIGILNVIVHAIIWVMFTSLYISLHHVPDRM